MFSTGALRETGITEALQAVLSDFASRSSDGIAYGASFEKGPDGLEVIDRYALLFKPEMVDRLKPAVKVNAGEPRALNLIPPSVKDVTVINVEDPNKTLDAIEAAVSARIGAGQSFLLHQFLLGAREAFFGLKAGDSAASAIGSEIASFDFTKEPDARVWLIAVRDRALLARIVERFLATQGATIKRENYNGVEIINSSDARRGAACFAGDFLALGGRAQLIHLIEAERSGQSLKSSPQFAAASRPRQPAAMLGFSLVKDESGEMMNAIARWMQGPDHTQPSVAALDQLPFAASATSLNGQGVYIESHAPFGNFPFLISIVDGAVSGKP